MQDAERGGRHLPSAGRGRSAPEHDRDLPGRHVGRPGERALGRLSVRQRAGVFGRNVVHRAGRGRPAGAPRGLHGRGRDQPPVNAHQNIMFKPVRRPRSPYFLRTAIFITMILSIFYIVRKKIKNIQRHPRTERIWIAFWKFAFLSNIARTITIIMN